MANKSISSALPRGMNLSCVTMRGDSIRGNVIAADENFGALILRDGTSDGTVHVVNLRYLTDLNIHSSSNRHSLPALHPINLQKVQKRLEGTLEERWSQVQVPKAQNLFNKIKKLFEDTRWDGSVIVVLNDTFISQPYNADSVHGNPKTVEIIRNQLIKVPKVD